jgi:hypothetical protein
MNSRIWFIWFVSGLLGLAACGPDIASEKGIATDIVIVYQRAGGFSGITQEWTIHPDGRVQQDPGENQLAVSPNRVIDLLAMTADAGFSDLQDSYIPEGNCCDQYTYTITVKIGDQEKSIQTSDGSDHPEQLTAVLVAIEDLISAAEPLE